LPEREEEVAALFEVVCRTVDAVGRLKLSNKAKTNAITAARSPRPIRRTRTRRRCASARYVLRLVP